MNYITTHIVCAFLFGAPSPASYLLPPPDQVKYPNNTNNISPNNRHNFAWAYWQV